MARLDNVTRIEVGAVLEGFCGGYFGRDSYVDKRVEARGHDWVVVRTDQGVVMFASTEDGTSIDGALLQYVR